MGATGTMNDAWLTLREVRAGDRVAVLSPSWAAPAHYPQVHEQAMDRLRERLGLEPVEFPTTRRTTTPRERAADVNAAFADPSIRAILSTIGGDDQITMTPYLDARPVRADPKPFLGFSDNTNLLSWLAYHRVPAVHGGSTQISIGPGPAPHPLHLDSLRLALSGGDHVLEVPTQISEVGHRWDHPRALTDRPESYPAEPWSWAGPSRAVTGRLWGGCLEILSWVLAVGRFVRPVEEYQGGVLLLETSEELPSPHEVYRMLRLLGERGLLAAFDALVWGRPIVDDERMVPDPVVASRARAAYREQVLRAVAEYHEDMVVVQDVDCGHTLPQHLLPFGEQITVDGVNQRVTAHFRRAPRP
ncbi:LD-carboxypeptidase [Ornithinicoccus hortensis]|uniref:Muramoyltetrapeptide carboxypeptidase LdcA involved in peptidoglycan recycling n=2 Tax=Ornithinicoccus hortensis TaxID=82346 RepID=A0A542YMH1_9MICO|nr:muramoyltetrapeptide carboxypeptidase LdcA involved in peptidoglycan recycling [Ornithinicoccus hortensis]